MEIAGSIEAAILAGRLAPGSPLPTVRALAGSLSVSPSTVAAAYRSLRVRGLLVARRRLGTAVSPRPPVHRGAATPKFSPGVRDLATGNPDPALLPCCAPRCGRSTRARSSTATSCWTRHSAAAHCAASAPDGIPARDLCVVAGALDGLERVLAAHLRPGDRVAIEDPAFVGVRDLLAVLGLEAVPVGIDDSGPRPDALARALEAGVEALIVTPRAQNPTGAHLDPQRFAS